MAQHFGSSLARPWALVKWNAGSAAGRRPGTTMAYLTDDCGEHYIGGLIQFYQKRADPAAQWHFRFVHARKFDKADIAFIFPNGKRRGEGPSKGDIARAKKLVPKNPADTLSEAA